MHQVLSTKKVKNKSKTWKIFFFTSEIFSGLLRKQKHFYFSTPYLKILRSETLVTLAWT